MLQEGHLRVLTWNVWNDVTASDVSLRSRLIASCVERVAPDVLLFQEMTAEMFAVLTKWMPNYPHKTRKPSGVPYWTMIWSRFPLKHIVRQPFEKSTMFRDLLSCFVLLPDGNSVFVVTSHLESLGSGSLERESQMSRALELLYHPQVLGLSPRVRLFGGDMNLKPITDGDIQMDEAWWSDAWLLAGHDSKSIAGVTRKNDRLDRIYLAMDNHGSSWTLDSVEVCGKEAAMSELLGKEICGSDHFAVLVQLSLVNPSSVGQQPSVAHAPTSSIPKVQFHRPDLWWKFI